MRKCDQLNEQKLLHRHRTVVATCDSSSNQAVASTLKKSAYNLWNEENNYQAIIRIY